MAHDYQTQRANLFTDDGLKIRDNAHRLMSAAGQHRLFISFDEK